MKSKYDIQLMVKVAQLYYESGYKQEAISKELGISRSSISMIITEAKEQGIVEICVKNPLISDEKLAGEFMNAFPIKDCVIIPTNLTDPALLTKVVAKRASSIVDERMKSNAMMGIAWGSTCFEFMMSYDSNKDLNGINIVPLIGGSNRVSSEYHLNETVRMFAEKVNGIPTFIHALGIPQSIEDKNLYMKSSEMVGIAEKWQNIDVAVISSGATPSHMADVNAKAPVDNMEFYLENPQYAVGDICARRFNIHGEFIDCEHNEKVIGIPIEDLMKSNHVVCIATGSHKALSLVGALKTKIIDLFITDEQTARSILSYGA